jgi:hypothetical protein
MFEEKFWIRSESEVTMESFVILIDSRFFMPSIILLIKQQCIVNKDDKICSWKKNMINTKQDKENKYNYSGKLILEAKQCGVQIEEQKWKKK